MSRWLSSAGRLLPMVAVCFTSFVKYALFVRGRCDVRWAFVFVTRVNVVISEVGIGMSKIEGSLDLRIDDTRQCCYFRRLELVC